MNDSELEEVVQLLGISPESRNPEERIRLLMERLRVEYSLSAGLLFGIMQGWAAEQSLELADLISSYVVRQVSATPRFQADLLAQIRDLILRATPNAVPAQS
jgi:hypothetical protein